MKTAILIPYNKQYELTKECVRKIQVTTTLEQVVIILVHAYINEEDESLTIPDVITARFKNESYCRTINQGLALVPNDCEYVFIMGNDSFPETPHWLYKLREQLKDPVKVLSPDYSVGGKNYITSEDEDFWYHNMIPSIHFFMRLSTVKELGPLDERFTGPCYYSDNEYCDRIIGLYGPKSLARSKSILFEHRLSQEGKSLFNVAEQMNNNLEIYKQITKEKRG